MTRKIGAMVLTALLVLGAVTGCSGKGVMAPSGDMVCRTVRRI